MPKNKKNLYKPAFYIAHTFSERIYVRDELIPALHRLGIRTLNPFYNPDGTWKESRPEIKLADEGGLSPKWAKTVRSRSVDIVETDLDLIRQADGIIAYMPEGSTGTTCEIWTCGGVFKWLETIGYDLPEFQGKPVFLVTTSSRLQMHPWIKYSTKRIFKDEKKLLKYLKKEMPRLRVKLEERRKILNATPKNS